MPRLKVMTIDLCGFRGEWPTRRDRLLEYLQQEEIDVVLLQEVRQSALRPNQAMELAQLSGYGMAFIPSRVYFPWPTYTVGLGMLSRFPISNLLSTEVYPPLGYFFRSGGERRIALRAEISLDGMAVVIYNTHFPCAPDARMKAARRLWTQVVQEEAVLVVVGGDFDAPPEEDSILLLQGKKPMNGGQRGELVDAWATAGVGPGETYPAHGPRTRVDYIFYEAEPSVVVQETKVIGRAPVLMSNHAAVVATFAISPARDLEPVLDSEPVASLEPSGGGSFGF